ncbi:hypothetical protein HY501_00205 [Candidatus Woesearchaeota archaeon]|nr:hypothetical protein [Candidatus Woesearchaeota archaeon]
MVILVRYGEIGLKGNNRPYFEKQLVRNIKYFNPGLIIARKSGRLLLHTDQRLESLKYTYGIVTYSYASEVEMDLEKIKQEALKYYTQGTFKVHTQRLAKKLKESREISRDVGAYIVEKAKAKVDLTNPDCTIFIELIDDRAYIFSEKVPGLGGLPAGVEGYAAVILEEGSSIEAAKAVLKRGCRIVLVKKNNVPFGSLEKYCPFKLKIAETIPESAEAVVTSETLGNLKKNAYGKLLLRPLLVQWQK